MYCIYGCLCVCVCLECFKFMALMETTFRLPFVCMIHMRCIILYNAFDPHALISPPMWGWQCLHWNIFIPHATSCGGYDVFDLSVSQSVSQSVSPVFLVSETPLKPLNRISWNFLVMKDIMCRCAYPQEILIHFFSRSYALFELRNLTKMKDTTQNSLSVPLKLLNRI